MPGVRFPCPCGVFPNAAREDREWLEGLPYTLSFPSLGCVVVHAGLVPGVPLEDQNLGAMTRMRNVVEVDEGKLEPREALSEGMTRVVSLSGRSHEVCRETPEERRGFVGDITISRALALKMPLISCVSRASRFVHVRQLSRDCLLDPLFRLHGPGGKTQGMNSLPFPTGQS